MGFFDRFRGPNKEAEALRQEIAKLKKQHADAGAEHEQIKRKNLQLVDKTHAFMQLLKVLVGTLEDEYVLNRCWDLLDLALEISKGGIFTRTDDGWVAEHAIGFPDGEVPVIPLAEESMVTFASQNGVIMSTVHLRRQDDLAYLEHRGAIPDTKIVCPVRVQGEIGKMILICTYAGNVFASEDDQDIVQMVATLLGLVLSNTQILAQQQQTLDQQIMETVKLRKLFSSMVAPEVVKMLEEHPGGIVLGGERQEVAIMFADIRNFTTLSEQVPPELVIEMLNEFFSMITDVVIRTKGTLDKFMGDAAMALYGTPVPLENPALTAVRAAIKIQQTIRERMPEWTKKGFPKFTVGIGVNYQAVVVGNVGSERLSNFTAIGDGVNLACRLCDIAKGGEILISQACFDMLERWPGAIEERHGVVIKGKHEPVTAYSVLEETATSSVCPSCKNPLQLKAKFCGNCGFRRP